MKQWFRKIIAGLSAAAVLIGSAGVLPEGALGGFNFETGAASIVESGSCGDSATYTIDSDGKLTIRGTGIVGEENTSHLPWDDSEAVKSAVVEEGITYLGCWALALPNLTTVSLPASLVEINDACFSGCPKLKSITVSSSSETFCSVNGILFSKDMSALVRYPAAKTDKSYTVPKTVKTIICHAFDCGESLTSVTIPDSVESIEAYAFSDCHGLTEITIPDSVTYYASRAVSYCDNIRSVTLSANAELYSSGDNLMELPKLETINVSPNSSYLTVVDGVLFNKNMTRLLRYPCASKNTSYTIPNGVQYIGNHSFDNCSELTSLYIPVSVEGMATYIFSYDGTSVTDIYFDGLAEQWEEARGRAVIPKSITIHYAGVVTSGSCGENATYMLTDNGTLIISGSGGISDYEHAGNRPERAPWYDRRSEIKNVVIQDGISYIGNNAFTDCTYLESVSLASDVREIGNYAFYNCTLLKNIVLPDYLLSIGDYAFNKCVNLSSITVPHYAAVGKGAFESCTRLNNVRVYSGNISDRMFFDCQSLSSFVFPENTTYIGEFAFRTCNGLTEITLPDSLKEIAGSAFYGCMNLKTVNMGRNVTSINKNAFWNCISLTDIYYDGTQAQWNEIDKSEGAIPENCTIHVAPDGTSVINPDKTYQTIQGFGGTNIPDWTGSDLSGEEVQKLFGNGEGELGLSVLRVFISDNQGQWTQAVATAKLAQDLGAVVIASPWNPPASIRSNGAGGSTGGKYVLNTGAEAQYAHHLNNFIQFMKEKGVDIYAVSVQNEPDYAEEWTFWSADRITNFIANYGAAVKEGTNTLLMAPESMNYQKSYYRSILTNASAMSNIDIFATHLYGVSRSGMDYPDVENSGKPVWATETYCPDSRGNSADNYPDALEVSVNIHNALVSGNMSTYLWWYLKRSYSPMKENGEISKRGYCMGQYSKFVRPGYVRVDATENPSEDVYVSAYKGDDGRTVIVAVNKGDDCSQRFIISDKVISEIAGYRTSADENIEFTGYLKASENGSFDAALPADSVTTFVIGTKSKPVPSPVVTATAGDGEITLSWEAIPDATKYAINRYNPSTKKFKCLKSAYTDTEITITGLENGYEYTFLVQAYVNGAWSSDSEEYFVSATPVSSRIEPVVTATPGDGEITLSWEAIPDATKYAINRYNPSTKKFKCLKSAYTDTEITITGLENGYEYTFLVQAYVNGAWSSDSEEYFVSVTPVSSRIEPVVTAIPGDGEVTLSWEAISGATKYAINRYNPSTKKFKCLQASYTDTEITIKDLVNGYEYIFLVQAYVNGAWSSSDEEYFVYVTPATLITEPDVTATPGDGEVTLSWTAIQGATKYAINRYNPSTKKFKCLQASYTDTEITIKDLANGYEYIFLVQAYVNGAWSSSDEEYFVYVTPAALITEPDVTATPGDGEVTLSWEAIPDATKYAINRYNPSTKKFKCLQASYTDTEITIKDLVNGYQYIFLVQAYVNGAWSSSDEEYFVYVTPAALITEPVVTATPGDGEVTLSWTAIQGATKYAINRYNPSTKKFKCLQASYTDTEITIKDLVNGYQYIFLVQAYVNGAWSSADEEYFVSVTPVSSKIEPVVTATPGDGEVTLSWTAIQGATKYAINRYNPSTKKFKCLQAAYNGTEITIKDLVNGYQYIFLVQAYVNGAWSSADEANFVSVIPAA